MLTLPNLTLSLMLILTSRLWIMLNCTIPNVFNNTLYRYTTQTISKVLIIQKSIVQNRAESIISLIKQAEKMQIYHPYQIYLSICFRPNVFVED